MEKRNNSRGLLSRIMGNIFASWTLVAAAAAAAVAIVLTLVHLNRNTTISIGSDNRIDPTPHSVDEEHRRVGVSVHI